MTAHSFIDTFIASAKHFIRNPIMIFPGLLLWGVLVGASKISEHMNYRFITSLSSTLWIIFFSLVVLAVMSFFFSGFIGMSLPRKEKTSLVVFVNYANRFWLRNFFAMVLVVGGGVVLGRVVHLVAFYIGAALNLPLGPAQAVFLVLYLGALFGFLLFFMFSSFFLVSEEVRVVESLKKSRNFVKKHYPAAVVLSLVLYALYYGASFIPAPYGEIVEYGVLVPYLSILLTRFIRA